MKVTFVVLHYETIEDTKECLDSLQKYMGDQLVNVVVVDNGSKKGLLKVLEPEYCVNDRIHFLYSDENLGFAKGNNLGFFYAKKYLKSDIIVLSNNDIVYKQQDFVDEMIKVISKQKIDVAGPQIISLVDKKNQNPVPVLYPDIISVTKRIWKFYILYCLSYFNMDTIMKKIFSKEVQEYSAYENNYQLHGACLILSNRFIDLFDGLYDGTFMYMEEGILKYMVEQNELKMEYIDTLKVFHKEGSSTGKIYGEGKVKRQFYYKWNIDGCKKLRNMMLKSNKLTQ